MSHAKIGRFSKKQIFELPDGTHRLEPHLYVPKSRLKVTSEFYGLTFS